MRWAVCILLLLLLPSHTTHAQNEVADSTIQSVNDPDSPANSDIKPIDNTRVGADTIESSKRGFAPSKSPGLAVLLSAVVPGAGQAYNESYWKIPIVLGLGIYFASQWLHNNRLVKDFREQFSITGNPQDLARRDFYKDQRDTFTWYIAILYFANILDAYVDASLYDFDVGSDLSIRLIPEPTFIPHQNIQLNLQATF
jgi:hypothetical protein